MSPMKTGARNCQSRIPSMAIALPLKSPVRSNNPVIIDRISSPYTTRWPYGVSLANSTSVWMGLKSPLNPAKATTSVSVMVRAGPANESPGWRSSRKCASIGVGAAVGSGAAISFRASFEALTAPAYKSI